MRWKSATGHFSSASGSSVWFVYATVSRVISHADSHGRCSRSTSTRISSATAIDDEYCELRFAFTVKKLVNEGVTSTVGAAFQREIARQLEQDIPIWENKIYVQPPVLVDGDGPIGMFRRWCEQFYATPQQEAAAE